MSSQDYQMACESGEPLKTYWPFHLAQNLQILLSAVSIVMVLRHFPLKKSKGRNLPTIHSNFTILLINGVLIYLIHAFFLLLAGVRMQIKHFFYPECSFTIVTWKCLVLRSPIFLTIVGISLLHLFLFLERCLATKYLKHYASHGAKFGIVACIAIWLASVCCNLYIVKDDDLFAYKAYCLQASALNFSKMMQMFYTLLAINVFTTIGDLVLLKVNHIQQTRRVFDYNLLKSYQIVENRAATKLMLKLSLVHSISFTSYLLATLTARYMFKNATLEVYVTSIEIVQLLICLNILSTLAIASHLKKSIKIRTDISITSISDQADAYFNQFACQLSAAEKVTKNFTSKM
uniref:Gustatory receptor n=1 Tax=Ditylenchus dipsaci TaxID=166011 RepID=A0A915EEM5_9BILA